LVACPAAVNSLPWARRSSVSIFCKLQLEPKHDDDVSTRRIDGAVSSPGPCSATHLDVPICQRYQSHRTVKDINHIRRSRKTHANTVAANRKMISLEGSSSLLKVRFTTVTSTKDDGSIFNPATPYHYSFPTREHVCNLHNNWERRLDIIEQI